MIFDFRYVDVAEPFARDDFNPLERAGFRSETVLNGTQSFLMGLGVFSGRGKKYGECCGVHAGYILK